MSSSNELIKEEDQRSSYFGGIVAVIVIVILLALIGLATYLTMPGSDNNNYITPFYFSDIFKVLSSDANFEFEWKGENLIFRNSSDNFYIIKAIERNHSTYSLLLPKLYYRKGMKISTDLSLWLIPKNHKKTQNLEDVYSYEIMYLTNNLAYYRKLQINNSEDNYFSAIAWGPQQKCMTAIYQGNIYYSTDPLMENSFTCLSCYLAQGKLYGQFIGYYAKHIFKTNMAHWWSADGRLLAFISLADEVDKLTTVEIFNYDSLYSKFTNISYSKAGMSPSPYRCEIYVIDISTQRRFHLDLSRFIPFRPYFIIHIQWYNSSSILVSILSQEQKTAAVLFCLIMDEKCFVVLEQTFSNGWIDLREYQDIIVLPKQGSFAMALTTSDIYSAQRHLAILKIDKRSKNVIKWLTTGNNYILKLYTFDNMYLNIFYLGREENASIHHLYRTNIENIYTQCVSCQLTVCLRNRIFFSSKNSIFLRECNSDKPKQYQLISLNLKTMKKTWSTNLDWKSDIAQYLKNKSLSKVEDFQIQLVDNNKIYYVLSKIYHPRSLNPEHVIKYPVVLILPDDPFNTNIMDDSRTEWIEYLTSFLRFVVIQLEVRGSANHYFHYHTSLANKLGYEDAKDILSGMKTLFEKRKYLDNSSISVIGQAYGGYIAVKLLYGHDGFPNFRCGVSINPIFDFSIYDSTFSERYLQIYKKESFYYKNSKLKFTSKLPREFLLVHDMTQNDVLFENSAKLIRDLVGHNIQFDYVPLYEDHSEAVPWIQNRFLLKKVTTFLTNCFNRSSVQYSLLANSEYHSI